VCPGEEKSAGVSASNRSPKGNRFMRRLLNQCVPSGSRAAFSRSSFGVCFHASVSNKQFGPIAHRLTRLIWKILHQGVRYEERGPAVNQKSRSARTAKMIKELRTSDTVLNWRRTGVSG
jgi:hypothetical protein